MGETRLTYFGEFAVEAGGERITRFDTQRAAKLVALIGLSRSKRLSRAELADLLWPDDFPDATRLRLRQELARARKALGAFSELLIADGEFISLAQTTSDREELLSLSRIPGDSPAYLQFGAKFGSTLGQEFLRAWDEPWVLAERQQAHSIRREVVLKAGTQYLLDGRAQDALEICSAIAEQDPLDEPVRMLLVQAYAATGSMTQAMSEFQQLKRALRDQNRNVADESESLMADLGSRPAVRTPDLTGGGWRALPVNISRTYGRTAEREAIAQRWASGSRLVTLVGPGGIGKTHLALEAARDAEQGDGHRVGWVPLAEITEADRFPEALLYQANLFAPDNVDALEMFIRSVGATPTLLVLDNAEHLLPDFASTVRRLLESLPALRLLVTSRVPLGISVEQQIRVGPLDAGTEGRELLLDLWRGLRPNLTTNAEIDAELTELAKRVDGYPLALRLIAPRLKLRSPGMVLRDLGSTPIAAALDDLPERHRDLSALIGGSLDTLSASRREVLTVLTMFPSGALVDQLVDAVSSPEALDDLDFLVDQSLVSLDEGAHVRLRTLELVRSAVREEASSEELGSAGERFIRAMTASVRRELPNNEATLSADQLDRFDEETANVHEAIRLGSEIAPALAAELMVAWWRQDLARGRYRYLAATVPPLVTHADAESRGTLALALGIALNALGRDAECTEWLERAIFEFKNLGHKFEEALAHARLAGLERRTRTVEVAVARARGALKLAEESGSRQVVADCELTLGVLLIFANESVEAGDHIRRAVEISRDSGEETLAVNAGLRYMSVLHGRADFAGMLTELERLIPLAERLRDPGVLSFAHELRGRALIGLERPAEAELSFRESYSGWEQLGNAFQMADQSLSLSRAFADQEMGTEAEMWLQRSAQLWMEAGDPGGLNAALTILARCWMMRGDQLAAARVLGYQAALSEALSLRLVDSEIEHRDRWRAIVGELTLPAEPASGKGALELFHELPPAPLTMISQIMP